MKRDRKRNKSHPFWKPASKPLYRIEYVQIKILVTSLKRYRNKFLQWLLEKRKNELEKISKNLKKNTFKGGEKMIEKMIIDLYYSEKFIVENCYELISAKVAFGI
jgi:hypothetical protein